MRLFRRRAPRHALGAAVRDIPHAPPPVLVHPPAELVLPAQRARVELGFRDGTTAALAPDSAQSRALVALADVLTRGQ